MANNQYPPALQAFVGAQVANAPLAQGVADLFMAQENTMASMRNRIEEQDVLIATHTTQMTQIDQLNNLVGTLKTQMVAKGTQIETLNGQMVDKDTRIGELTGQVGTLTNDVAALRAVVLGAINNNIIYGLASRHAAENQEAG